MSKMWIRCLTAVAVTVMVLISAITCSADSSVTYTGNAGDFIFAPGSKESPTDLFENFKDAMPGDVLTQQIVIQNKADKQVDVEIFLKSLGADEASKAFLKQLSLSVKEVGGKELASGTAAEAADLSDFVSLGKFPSGGTTTLEVTLKIPADLSNEYASALGKVNWQFKVEEKPVEVPVVTGDTYELILYSAIFAAAVLGGVVLFVFKRKSHNS